MDHSTALAHYFLQGVQNEISASNLSIYLPSPSKAKKHTMLVHSGAAASATHMMQTREKAEKFTLKWQKEFDPEKTNVNVTFLCGDTANLVPLIIHISESPPTLCLPIFLGKSALSLPTLSSDTTPKRRATDGTSSVLKSLQPVAWLTIQFSKQTNYETFVTNLKSDINLTWLISLGSAISRHLVRLRTVLNDALTGLPCLAELQQFINELIRNPSPTTHPFALALLSHIDFAQVNESQGRENADQILETIGELLQENLRSTDFLARIGGAVFSIVFPHSDSDQTISATNRIITRLNTYAQNHFGNPLSFRCGISVYNGETPLQPQLLIQQAAQSLYQARLSNKDKIVAWPSNKLVQTSEVDPLTGVLTGDMARDYRRMTLMYQIVSHMAFREASSAIVKNSLESLKTNINTRSVHVVLRESEQELKEAETSRLTNQETPLEKQDLLLIEESVNRATILGFGISGVDSANFELNHRALVVPLTAGDHDLGCLYFTQHQHNDWLDVTDVLFLQGIATQIAVALDRANLAEQERSRQDEEKRRLKREFATLRAAFGTSKLVYRSPQMEKILDAARRVGNTGATVLLTGESGTGKGVLARTIHSLSARADRAFITVDCNAIAPTLIDNELFGHIRGAYTGAQSTSSGRIWEANGGTVFIDEIGELPLEVQGRLLTFVQDRKITPVGATKSHSIDVRIITATNRDLEKEVAAGRFREDLYYRINVVSFHLPPLRDRQEDLEILLRYFLDKFSVQYQKRVVGLTAGASNLVMNYSWPGNIRELENKLMRAVIMCRGELLEFDELSIAPQIDDPISNENLPKSVLSQIKNDPAVSFELPSPIGEPALGPKIQLQEWLTNDIGVAVKELPKSPDPIALWLEESLIEAAQQVSASLSQSQTGSVIRRAAKLLGCSESTYRRRLREVQVQKMTHPRRRIWQTRLEVLQTLIEKEPDTRDNLLKSWKQNTLKLVRHAVGPNIRAASQMMNATEQTIRKWSDQMI
ncbi:MAG: sigma 54-interacting transcriptional regulator [Myxococcota bacterium]|nr:sigma 54-interacting transcriptional regulator [Myxococcota bacterium]